MGASAPFLFSGRVMDKTILRSAAEWTIIVVAYFGTIGTLLAALSYTL